MNTLGKLLTSLGVSGRPALREIDAPTAREWLNRGNCQLIDVREELEYRAERIPELAWHLCPGWSRRCRTLDAGAKLCSCVAAAPGRV
ncbi:MAG TPA: hypothetical protein VI653_27445, partial [Steroidobacteraceae bacterium]